MPNVAIKNDGGNVALVFGSRFRLDGITSAYVIWYPNEDDYTAGANGSYTYIAANGISGANAENALAIAAAAIADSGGDFYNGTLLS